VSRGTLVLVAVAIAHCLATVGCSEDCCSFDGEPVTIKATSDGALWARIRDRASLQTGWALLDTSSPVNLWQANAQQSKDLHEHSIDVLAADPVNGVMPLRATFGGLWAQSVVLNSAVAELDGPVLAVLGGEFWRNYAPIFDRNAELKPTVTFWDRQPASTGFLDTAKYAVLEMDPLGGGQLSAKGQPDLFGIRGPHQFAGSQMVVRGCAAAKSFVPAKETLTACCRGDEQKQATGVDVALVVSTGIGGVLISESAWLRINPGAAMTPAAPGASVPIFHPGYASPVMGRAASLPSLALVNLESDSVQDPGACVELGRARRTELVAISENQNSSVAHCAEACDRDPKDSGKGVASAAYVELTQGIEVFIVPDNSAILQAIRAEIRPEGPEIDGLLGASALKSLRIELDYRPRPARLILSCQATESEKCRAVGRCPRLPNKDSRRVCFDLPARLLPEKCDNYPRPECQ
jgi:hypothetical protein